MKTKLFSWLFVAMTARGIGMAQSASASISGSVMDVQEAVLEGASIVLTDENRGLQRTTQSNGAGSFEFVQLMPGSYRVRVEKTGFGAAVRSGVRVNVNDQLNLRFALDVATRADAVSVSAEADRISESPAVRTVVDRQFIENQPLNGRSLQSLIALSPGVVVTSASLPTPGQFSVNGQRANSNAFMVDGVSANFGTSASVTPYEPMGGTSPAFSALGSTTSLASLDSLEEFSIQTSTYAPEFGRQPGAQVSLVTRSGSNDLHGSLFYYFRNDKLDANNWFANANALPRRALRQNDFGGTLGGKLIPNRTFFFASHESLILRQPFVTPPLTVPSLAARQNATGVIKDLLNAFPLPVAAPAGDPQSTPYIATLSNPASLYATSARIDHSISSKWQLFGRFHNAPSKNEERAKFCAASCVSVTDVDVRTYTAALTGSLAPSLHNDLRFNWSGSRTNLSYFLDAFGGAVVPPAASLYPSFTDGGKGYIYVEVDPSGANTLSDGLFVTNKQRQLQFVETLSWTRGNHSAKFGYDFRRLTPVSDSGSYRRSFRFNNLAELAAGVVPSAALIAPDVVFEPVFQNHSLFAQDTWRIHPRLSLTYGLRYELVPSPSERNGNAPRTVINLDNPSALDIAPPNAGFFRMRYGNIAPRLGASYRVTESGRLVLRGGYGLFYDLGYGFLGNAFSTSLWPYARTLNLSNVRYDSPQASAQPPANALQPPYPRLFAYEDDFQLPRIHQYNAAVEYAMSQADSMTVTYVGSAGRRLGRVEQLRNLKPGFTRIDAVRSNATADYDALQLQYQRRLSQGFQALANYTWSKSLDTASEESINNFQAPALRLDPQQDRGPSSFDLRHQMNLAISYALPFGISIDGIARARSATPVAVVTGRDPFGFGVTTVSRPDVVASAPQYIDDPNAGGGRRFNPAAFDSVTPVQQGRQGTLGRNVLRGFSAWQMDLSLRREFKFGEIAKLNLHLDAFNLTNHANFANPNGILTSPLFGRSTQMLGNALGGLSPLFQMGGPRSLQLAMRLQF